MVERARATETWNFYCLRRKKNTDYKRIALLRKIQFYEGVFVRLKYWTTIEGEGQLVRKKIRDEKDGTKSPELNFSCIFQRFYPS